MSAYLIFWPMYYEGMAGLPRRYFDFSSWTSFNQFWGSEYVYFCRCHPVICFVQLVFLLNFFISIFKGEKVTEKNPWQSNTLEWTTPIHPGHVELAGRYPGGFQRTIRICKRRAGLYPAGRAAGSGAKARAGESIMTFLTFGPADIFDGHRVAVMRIKLADEFGIDTL